MAGRITVRAQQGRAFIAGIRQVNRTSFGHVQHVKYKTYQSSHWYEALVALLSPSTHQQQRGIRFWIQQTSYVIFAVRILMCVQVTNIAVELLA